MVAGRGLIHAEVSSDQFKQNGGRLEILQLWINLPSKLKMSEPVYTGFQNSEIPHVMLDEEKVKVNVISGTWDKVKGAYNPPNPVQLNTIEFSAGGRLRTKVPAEENIFLYVVRGSIIVNGQKANSLDLIEFNNDGEDIEMTSEGASHVIFGHAKPLNEPVIAHGPFVMNTMEEIREAYNDYKSGKFGHWEYEE